MQFDSEDQQHKNLASKKEKEWKAWQKISWKRENKQILETSWVKEAYFEWPHTDYT